MANILGTVLLLTSFSKFKREVTTQGSEHKAGSSMLNNLELHRMPKFVLYSLG